MPDSFRVVSPKRPQGKAELVSDLMDPEKKRWNVDKVRRIFLPHEANLVLSIPVSHRLPEDSIIWGWTNIGCSETTGHILWGCSYAKKVGSETKIKLPLVPDLSREFANVIWEIREFHSTIDWVVFAVTAWSLWNNRNNAVHSGLCKGQVALIRAMEDYVEEIKQVMLPRLRLPTPPPPPPKQRVHGYLHIRDGIKSILMVLCLARWGVVESVWL